MERDQASKFVNDLLRLMVSRNGSDLFLTADFPPAIKVDGKVTKVSPQPLTGQHTLALTRSIMNDKQAAEFERTKECNFAVAPQGIGRFRVNAFKQRGNVSIAFRVIPFQVRSIADLGLPEVIRDLADEARGIILLTGTTGSGKSTTLAAMIDQINSNKSRHIVTLEDPIEYLHRDKLSIINQREIGHDTESFARAMRRVLRQDPDVILIGEMRDEETVRTALSAAETGHLVMSTLHTLDASETINRIIDFFPPHLQQQARVMLAATLRGVVSQRLVPRADGNGRIAACEVMVVTGRVQDLILNPEETGRITEVISEGSYYGMQTFDQSLLAHVTAGSISEKTAMEVASSPHDFKLMLDAQGQRASGIEQVSGAVPESEDSLQFVKH